MINKLKSIETTDVLQVGVKIVPILKEVSRYIQRPHSHRFYQLQMRLGTLKRLQT